jgi:membrane fusion protein (multidrug efflux system)
VHVVSGLAAGDMVVTAGQIKLQDGTPVKVVPGPGQASIDGTKGASPEAEERARP